jgi:hypothetical protein
LSIRKAPPALRFVASVPSDDGRAIPRYGNKIAVAEAITQQN